MLEPVNALYIDPRNQGLLSTWIGTEHLATGGCSTLQYPHLVVSIGAWRFVRASVWTAWVWSSWPRFRRFLCPWTSSVPLLAVGRSVRWVLLWVPLKPKRWYDRHEVNMWQSISKPTYAPLQAVPINSFEHVRTVNVCRLDLKLHPHNLLLSFKLPAWPTDACSQDRDK